VLKTGWHLCINCLWPLHARYEALLKDGAEEQAKAHEIKRDTYIARVAQASEKLKALTVRYEAVRSRIDTQAANKDCILKLAQELGIVFFEIVLNSFVE